MLFLAKAAKDVSIEKDYHSKEYNYEKKDNSIKCPNCESSRFERKGFRAKTSLEKGIEELIKGYQVIKRNQYSNI